MQATDRFFSPERLVAGALVSLLLWAGTGLSQALIPPPRLVGKVMVADIQVQGNTTTPTDYIINMIQTRAGTTYSQQTIDEDVRRLLASGRFANVQVGYVAVQDGRAVKVIITIFERPSRILDIQYLGGQHLGKVEELTKLTGLHKGDPMVPWRNKEAALRLREKCLEDGRPWADVRLLEGANPTDTRVIFDITEGPKVKVSHIYFTGNTFMDSGNLKYKIESSAAFLGILGGRFNPLMVNHDETELEDWYKGFGFHEVKVRRELEVTGPDCIDITYHIYEGPRYRLVDRPTVVGVGTVIPREALEAQVKIQPGAYVLQKDVKADAKRIEDYYGTYGYKVHVLTEVTHPPETPGICQVVYRVAEHTPARVGKIIIVGNDVTRDNVILRLLPDGLKPGQILSYPDVALAKQNLTRANIFNDQEKGIAPSVEVLDAESDSEWKDVLIRVNEQRTGSLIFGVGVNSDAGLNGSIVLNERNFDITRFPTSWDDVIEGRAFRGAGQDLRINASPGTEMQNYSATWREPHLFDSDFSLTVGGYYYTRVWDEYTESRLGGKISLARRLNQFWTASVTTRLENVGVVDVPTYDPPEIMDEQGYHFVAGFGVGLTRDTRDTALRATEGSVLDIRFEQVTGSYTYPLFNVDFSKYWTLWQRADGTGRQVLALRSGLGIAGSQTPVYDDFYEGGSRSVRGFEFRGISPQNPLYPGLMIGGDFMLFNSLEYQVPVMAGDRLWLVGFVDSGTVERDVEIRDYRVSVGFGLRIAVPMLGPMPIALDFGFPIVKASTDRTQIFSFNIGFFH